MSSGTSWYLKVRAEDIAEHAILVGDPTRVQVFADQMTDVSIKAQEREFTTLTGNYDGVEVSVVSVGIGAPSAAIVMEELWELGVKVVIRAGTAIALNTSMGSFILANGAIRHEGVSPTYLPVEFPAVCDAELLRAFQDTMREAAAPHKVGIVGTSDGFYTHLFDHNTPGRTSTKRPETLIQRFTEYGILGADMETSAVYTVGHFLGLKALSVLAATVDGKTRTMMQGQSRADFEALLATLVLKGLHRHATRPGTGT